MTAAEPYSFECRLYVSSLGPMKPVLDRAGEPRKLIAFRPIEYDKLVDPAFRRLIATFESLPESLPVVQVVGR